MQGNADMGGEHMMEFDIREHIPKFLRKDRNGYALAMAMNAGIAYYLDKVKDGINIILDVDTMPEWRLDELAGELGCIYDYAGSVTEKRKWISNAIPYYSGLGTVDGVLQGLNGLIEGAVLQEAAAYGGSAFHFRIVTTGNLNQTMLARANAIVERTKNVRSILDSISPISEEVMLISDTGTGMAYSNPSASDETYTGGDEL